MPDRHDKLTIISMAVVASALATLFHEGVGHGLTARLRVDGSLCDPRKNLSSASQTGWRHSGRRKWPAYVDQRYRRHWLHHHKRVNDCGG